MERFFASYAALKISHIMGRMADMPLPQFLLKPLIQVYSRGIGVDTNESIEPEGGFRSFGQFFGRRLRSDARPICREENSVASPCDGELVAMGTINSATDPTFAIKGYDYNVGSLLGDPKEGKSYRGGSYLVIYLHPRDYHRVHVPVDGALTGVRSIPGARYSVASWCESRVFGIYGKNERMTFSFELAGGGNAAVIMVAAFGVGNIESQYGFDYGKNLEVLRERRFEPGVQLAKGEELGAFLLGSTVVVLFGRDAFEVSRDLALGSMTMGQRIGAMKIPSDPSSDVRN